MTNFLNVISTSSHNIFRYKIDQIEEEPTQDENQQQPKQRNEELQIRLVDLSNTIEKQIFDSKWIFIFFMTALSLIIIGLISLLVYFYVDDMQTYQFVYINDLHVDTKYQSASSHTTYCRKYDEIYESNPFIFGQYGCDSSPLLFQSMVENIPKFVKKKLPQFVLFGGDGPGHGLNNGFDGHLNLISGIVENMTSMFGKKVPLLYVLGNNDYYPNYGAHNYSTDIPIFEGVADVLDFRLDDEQKRTFRKGGYYYHDFPNIKLRMVMLNSIIYNKRRDYMDDPYDQFHWLLNVSKDAHQKNLKVGLALHMPPGVTYTNGNYSNLNHGWNIKYIEKFDEIVALCEVEFIMAAHSHYDMIIPLNGKDSKSQTYSLSAPSISPSHKTNPSFRIFSIKKGTLKSYNQYYADLLLNPKELEWKLEYQFHNAYPAKDISKKSLRKIVDWISSNTEARWRYNERVHGMPSDNGLFYYCILSSTTEDQVRQCINSTSQSFNEQFKSQNQK